MAQAVFDEHPLEKYLQAIESPITMPGGELVVDEDPLVEDNDYYGERHSNQYWIIPDAIQRGLNLLRHSSVPNPFVEQFKYNVISSSLLAAELSTPARISAPPSAAPLPLLPRSAPSASPLPAIEWSTPLAVALVLLATGNYLWSVITLVGTCVYVHTLQASDSLPEGDMTLSMDTLTELVTAGNLWDTVVHDAIAMLEGEERSIFYGPTTPASPSSSLRVALHSTLQTTQSQCDNVRQLFAALTSPNDLSQMSEMYAPPSPMKPLFTLEETSRPTSLPSRKSMVFKTPENKRSTWNGGGSYSFNDLMADGGSPTSQVLKRRQNRRSALAMQGPRSVASSVPTSPTSLANVREEHGDGFVLAPGESAPNFGMAALDLRRSKRASVGQSPHLAGARLTTMHSTRHPLSMSALHHALQGAIASKRYACSHLLALRFNDEEEESYWEDVRSVMALLTTTFVDASSRLTEALDDADNARIRDQHPTPESKAEDEMSVGLSRRPMRAIPISFAPMPSHLTRLATHFDAISTSLVDARDHLEQCVSSLKGPSTPVSESDERFVTPPSPPPTPPSVDSPALQAYDRLRRELGIALRECERGRERLLDVLSPTRNLPREEEYEDPMTPELRADVGTSDEDASPDEELHLPVSFSTPLVALNDDDHVEKLPAPGIEQVFEAETGPSVLFTRERSTLTREERIQKAKEQRRESGLGLGIQFNCEESDVREKWGPGGEVVQELKDVIWKVGERRRKMALEAASSSPQPEEDDDDDSILPYLRT